MLEENKIYLGDCLDLMPQIKNKSVDLILCDLPYGVLNRSNKNAQWDNIIPFEPLWDNYKRVIKDNGTIVLFAQGMFTAKLMFSNPEWWRYNLIWYKEQVTGFLDCNRKPLRCHEDICVFTPKYIQDCTYNPQMIKVEPHLRNHSRGGNSVRTNNCYGNLKAVPQVISDEKFPRSIISFPKQTKFGGEQEYKYHPTNKPVNLLRYLILTYSNEGELVLDNTMGSGSTCVACIKEKRKYIGIEMNEKYYNVAKERIQKELNQPTLF